MSSRRIRRRFPDSPTRLYCAASRLFLNLDVTRRRAARWGDGSKLYALTGYGQGEDRQRRSREAGFDGHFVKPIDPDHVLKLLHDTSEALPGLVASATTRAN